MNENKVLKKTSIGGQALIEGVMMRGPQKTAMAVRHTSGELIKEEWENPVSSRPRICKWPFVRGLFNMIDSLSCGYKCLMRSAELSGFEDESPDKPLTKKEKLIMNITMVISTIIGVGLALGLFMYLPSLLYALLDDLTHLSETPGASVWRGIFEGIIRLLLFLIYLSAISLMKDIRRVFMYHGAEHKTIFCYENGEELTVENVRKQSRFHPRCGTSFLILTLLIGIVISICIQVDTVWLRFLIKIALLPITVGIGYESIKLAAQKNNKFTRFISAPGLWIQRLTTREPDDSMIECAIAAFSSVVPEDEKAEISL